MNASKDRLFERQGIMATGDMADELYAVAYNIEQTLVEAGAVAGEDYTYMDIMRLSQPFVLKMLENGPIDFRYPANDLVR